MKTEMRHGECRASKARVSLVFLGDSKAFWLRGSAMRWLAILALCLFAFCGRAEFPLTILGALNGGTDGSGVVGLTLGADGNFYGMAYINGKYGYGTIFKMTPAGSINTLVTFDGTNGGYPQAPLIQAADGAFYGVVGSLVFHMTTNGDLRTVFLFTNGSNSLPDGATGPLAQGVDGNFYGTTKYGGGFGVGSVFKLTPAGEVTILASFTGPYFTGTNGGFPTAGVVQGNDGNFYGTTSGGLQPYYGTVTATVFKITPEGALTTLADFDPTNDTAETPGLTLGSDGNFYGTTTTGPGQGSGTAFKVTPTGDLTILTRFTNCSYPVVLEGSRYTGLVQGLDGNFYGTTLSTSTTIPSTLYQMTPAGVVTTVAILPGEPQAGPILGKDGTLYGAADDNIYRFVPPPMFQGVTTTNGNVMLTWSAAIGQNYQAEYATNLASTNWLPVEAPITATNLTITVSDSPGTDAQRFYRVQLLP